MKVESCGAQEVRCEAVCECDEDFSGEYCSLSGTVAVAKRSSRLNLITALEGIITVDNQDQRSTENFITSLFNLGKNKHELNVTSCAVIFKIIEISLEFSKNFDVPLEKVEGSMYVLNECGYIYAASSELIFVNNRFVGIHEYIGLMIDKYSEVVFQDLVFGEGDNELNYPLFKVVNAVRRDTDSSTPMVLTTATTLSRQYGTDFSSVSITIQKMFSKLQLNMYESAKRFIKHNVISNPLQLSIAFGQTEELRALREEIAGVAVFTLQNNYPQEYGAEQFISKNVTFQTYCNDTVARERQYRCPSGYNITHRCDGRVGVISSSCPKATWQPLCSVIDGNLLHTSEKITQCKRLSYTHTSTVCECLLPNFNIHSKERTLEVTTVAAFLPEDDHLQVTFDEDTTYSDVIDFESSVMVISLVSLCWGIAFIMLVTITFNMQTKNMMWFRSKDKVDIEKESNLSSMTPVSDQEKVHWMSMVLMDIFPSESFYPVTCSIQRAWKVLTEEHIFTSLFVKKDKNNNKEWYTLLQMCKTLRLITSVTFLLFAVTLLFDIQFPNNKSLCSAQLNENDCLSEKNTFDDGQHLCYWYLSRRAEGIDVYACEYKEVQLTAWGVCLMALLVSCLLLPANFLFDHFFNLFILIPTKRESAGHLIAMKQMCESLVNRFKNKNKVVPQITEEESSDNLEQTSIELDVHESSETGMNLDLENNTSDEIGLFTQREIEDIKLSMEDLVTKIKLQRHYVPPEETAQFDNNWRWDAESGNFGISDVSRGGNQVGHEPLLIEAGGIIAPFHNTNYIKTQEEIVETISLCKQFNEVLLDPVSEGYNMVLLHAFVMDYLGRDNDSARVFYSRAESVFEPKQSVLFFHKMLAILFILALNSAFLCFVILQNTSRERSYQICFLIYFLIQFFIEYIYFEAMICLWMFYAIPLTVCREVQSAISALRESTKKAFLHRADVTILNATKWFFVSTKLAEGSPHLLESQVVLAHETLFRPVNNDALAKSLKLHKEDFYFNFSIAAQVWALLKLVGTVPMTFQRSVLYVLQLTAAFLLFSFALLIQSHVLWVLPVVFVVLYEVVVWALFMYNTNGIYSAEEVHVPLSKDLEEDLPSSRANSSDINLEEEEVVEGEVENRNFVEEVEVKVDAEEKEEYHHLQADLNDLDLLEQNINVAFNTTLQQMMAKVNDRKLRMDNEDTRYKEGEMRFVDPTDQERNGLSVALNTQTSAADNRAASRNDLLTDDVVLESTPMQQLTFSPSVSMATTSFVDTKKSRGQPPKKITADNLYDLSSDSSSDDNESVGQLNDIFDRFLSTGRSVHNNDNTASNNDGANDGDDDSMQDYDRLMTTFNFRNMEDGSDSGSDDGNNL